MTSFLSLMLLQMASHSESSPKAESGMTRVFMILFIVLLVIGLGAAIRLLGKGTKSVAQNMRNKDEGTQKKQ